MAHQIVMLTAQSKLYPAEDSGYLFLDTKVTADKGVGNVIFGRPWRAYARVYFVRTSFAKDVPLDPAGWSEWADKLKTADYADADTTIGGKKADTSKRIAPSRVLSTAEVSKLTAESWLNGWAPAKDETDKK
jgi:pectinesterase